MMADADRRRLVWPSVAAVAGCAILIGLGVWQVRRLAWKEDLLARIDARIHAAPRPLPPAADWPRLSPDDFDYTHVAVRGLFDPVRRAFVFRGSPDGAEGGGPGYLAMTPLAIEGGGTVIVNRGFVPEGLRDGLPPPPAGPVVVTGLMRPPEDRNLFTPADDPARGQWFTRDPAGMGAALGLGPVAPFTIDVDAVPGAKDWPRGGATVLNIPNNHLSYALTWFGLALGLAGVYAAYVRRALRGPSA